MTKREGPSANATPEEQVAYWRQKLSDIPYHVEDGPERVCPKCESTNPCSGVDVCGQCGKSLKNARRDPGSRRFSPSDY